MADDSSAWRAVAQARARRRLMIVWPVVAGTSIGAVALFFFLVSRDAGQSMPWVLVLIMVPIVVITISIPLPFVRRGIRRGEGMFAPEPLLAVDRRRRREVVRLLRRGGEAPDAGTAQLVLTSAQFMEGQRRWPLLWIGIALLQVPNLLRLRASAPLWWLDAFVLGISLLNAGLWWLRRSRARAAAKVNRNRWTVSEPPSNPT